MGEAPDTDDAGMSDEAQQFLVDLTDAMATRRNKRQVAISAENIQLVGVENLVQWGLEHDVVVTNITGEHLVTE